MISNKKKWYKELGLVVPMLLEFLLVLLILIALYMMGAI